MNFSRKVIICDSSDNGLIDAGKPQVSYTEATISNHKANVLFNDEHCILNQYKTAADKHSENDSKPCVYAETGNFSDDSDSYHDDSDNDNCCCIKCNDVDDAYNSDRDLDLAWKYLSRSSEVETPGNATRSSAVSFKFQLLYY